MSLFSDPWVARSRGLGPVPNAPRGPIRTVVPASMAPRPIAPPPAAAPRTLAAPAMPQARFIVRAPGGAPAAPPPPAAPKAFGPGGQPIPIGDKASCPVCRTFGGR
jgi:hypothetical protein